MRVLLFSAFFPPYGAGGEIVAERLARGLVAQGHEVLVATSHGGLDLPDRENRQGVVVRRFPLWQTVRRPAPASLAAAGRWLAALKRDFGPAVVHLNTISPLDPFHWQTLAAAPVPSVVTLHCQLEPTLCRPLRPATVFDHAFRRADALVACSQAVLTELREVLSETAARSLVIPNGMDAPTRPCPPVSVCPPRLLCLGRLAAEKGVDTALAAFARVRQALPAARLVIAGDGPERSALERLAGELGVAEAVRFEGWVDPEQRDRLLTEATLLLMPSHNEGFGLVALEAASMGRPVVAARVGGAAGGGGRRGDRPAGATSRRGGHGRGGAGVPDRRGPLPPQRGCGGGAGPAALRARSAGEGLCRPLRPVGGRAVAGGGARGGAGMSPAARSAVALFVFRRPAATAAVLEVLRAVQPPVIYVVADGPRPTHPEDAEACRLTRQVVRQGIDWPCAQHHLWSESNLGCGRSVPRGLSWVFEREEQAIVLEDDCIPEPTFFPFCDTLLERYRHDPRVTQVCGSNRLLRWKEDRQSYHFGYYGSAWGWATWRRAWALFDPGMSAWGEPSLMAAIEQRIADAEEFRYFVETTELSLRWTRDIWDYRWAFAQIAQGGLTATPAVNLVRNIGFGPDATHTRRRPGPSINLSEPLVFPLRAPAAVERDAAYDHAHFLWGIGRPDAASAATAARRLLEAGRAIDTLAVVQQSWQRDPTDRAIGLVRARALLVLDRSTQAIELLDQLLANDPDDAEAADLRRTCAGLASPGP